MKLVRLSLSFTLLLVMAPVSWAQNVFEDSGIGLTEAEVRFLVQYWTPQMKQAAADDMGDRIELLNKALINKKIAAEYDQSKPNPESDVYWASEIAVRNAKRKAQVERYIAELEVPDMSPLAEEVYRTEKDRYALVPEERTSSHILIRCRGEECLEEGMQGRAREVLDRLEQGEDFAALAAEYSEDPGSKDKGGKFDRWIKPTDKGVAREYLLGLYEIEKPGDVSEPVHSQFGLHIIRLDEVKPFYYKPFEEVKPAIIAALEEDYRTQALRVYSDSFNVGDDLKLDPETLDAIFAPFKTEQPAS